MTAPPVKVNFTIYQGSTFSEVLRWESATKVYKPITAITKTAPIVITAAGHGLPNNWRFRVTHVGGMKEINSVGDSFYIATVDTVDTISVNSINAIAYTTYTSGGVLEYNQPIDLTGYTARMQIRNQITDTNFIKELTTTNGGIVIDNTLKTIKIIISASDTAQFNFFNAVYSLELISSTGEVTQLINGTVTLEKEVTRS